MADNDGLLTNEEKNTYEKLINSIDNAGLTNETIHVQAEVTANTEKIDNQFVSLNKAIDETLDTLDRGVNQHKGAFDIWKTFGVELDSSAFGQDEANKDRAEKDAIYDQLALLAKALNKDPKLLGTLTSLNNKHLKLVVGKEGEKGYLDQAVKVIGFENGVIDKRGYKKKDEDSDVAGFVRLGNSVIASTKRDKYRPDDLNSTLFHEYGHLILQKILNDIGVEYKDEMTVEEMIYKLKGKINYLKKNKDSEYEIEKNSLLDKQLSGKITQEQFNKQSKEIDEIYNTSITKAEALLHVFENIDTRSTSKYAESNVKHHGYINDAHEVFARSFKNYVSGLSNITGGKRVNDTLIDRKYTRSINDETLKSFASLFGLMNGENIVASQDMLIKNLGQHKLKKGITSSEIIRIIDNINQNNDFSSALLQLQYVKKMFKENNIDVTDFNYSPFDIEYIMNAWTFGTDTKNERYKNKLYNFFTGDSEEKLNKFKEVEELGKKIGNLPYDNTTDKIKNLKNISETLRKIGYDNLSKFDIDTLLEVYDSLDPESKEDFKNLESSLKGALGRIPSANSDEKIRAEFSDKVKEQCAGINNFETCIKSLADTFKTQFESAIDNSANAFKLAFESAITSYGDVLARVNSGKNPFIVNGSTGGYKQEMIMAEHSSGNNKKVTFEEVVKEINQYVTSENIEKQLKGLDKINFQRFIKNMNDAVSTGDEKKKQSVMDSYQKDYVQNALTIFKSSVVDEQTQVVPSGFDVDNWFNSVRDLMNQIKESDLKNSFKNQRQELFNKLSVDNPLQEDINKANEFIEDLKSAVANAKQISETVKDTVKETVNSADTVKKTEEIINNAVNNTKKTIESGTGDSGKGGNEPPKEQKPPTKYTGQNFPVEYFGNTARNTNQGVNSNKFIIAGQDENSRPINAEHDKPLTNTGAIIKFDKNAQEWKINLGDVNKDNSLATLKQIMELNETATHILKHMSDFYKFQFNNSSNPEVTPMEWQNITYKYRSGRLDTKLFDNDYGYFSQNYKIGNEQRSYRDFIDENNGRADLNLLILQEQFNSIGDKIAKANIEGTNPMQTLKLLEEQAEIKAQMVFRTKELIKAERELFREQENQRRKDEKSEKVTLTRNETLDKLKRSLGDFNDKNVHDANNNIVKMGQFGDVAELRHISDMFNTADTLLNASDEEFKQAVKGIVEAINAYKESARRIKMSESDTAKEAKRQEKEIEKMTRDSKKEIKSGIKQADKMLAGDSTYKSIFGKYKIPELSRSGKFSLTDIEKTEVERIKNALKFQESLLGTTKTKANQEYLRGEIDKLNAELDNYITGTIAERAKEIAKLEDKYKQKVIPAMEKFNHNIGHIFNTNADIDYEQVRQGGFGKLKELSKFIDLDTMFNKVFNFANLKKSLSGFVSSVKGMFSSGVKMLESAFSKIYGIVSTVIKNITIAITGAVATVTAAVTGFVVGFAAMGKSIVGATDIYRKQTIAITGVYQSPTKSNQMINSVYSITRGMPIDYTQAVKTLSEMSAIPTLQTILKSNDREKSDALMTKMFKVITAMTTMRPDQKSSDAIFSLRNAFAGDLRSLQRRFDLPTANIMNVRGTMGLAAVKTDPMALLDSLENYFDTFLDVSTINKVSDTISVIIEKIKGAIDLFKANIGNSGFYDLVAKDFRKIRNLVLDFVTSDSGKSFAQRLSDVFSNVYNSIKDMAMKIKDIFSQIFDVKFDSLPEMFTSALEFFAKSVKYVDNLLDVKTVVDYVQKLLESVEELKKIVEPMIDTIKKKITEVIKTVLNFSITVLDVIGDVVGALKKTGLNDKGLFYLWLFGPGNVISLIGNGIGAITSGITASVISVGLLAKGFSSVAGFVGIASAKLVLIVGSVTALATALYDLISSFDTYSKIFDTIIDSLKVEFDQMIVEMGLPGSNAAKTRLIEGSDISYRGSVDDVIKNDLENYLKYANSFWNTGNIKTITDESLSNIIKQNKNDIYYSNGQYQVSERTYSGNDYKESVKFEKETFYLKQFAEYLNGLTDDVSVDMIARQKREKLAEERSKLFGQTKIGTGINAISGAFNGIGGGIDFVKSLFTGDSKGLEGAQTASKTAEQALKDFNKQLESYKNEKGEFDYERFENDIKAGLVKLTGIKDGIDKIHLDRVAADPEPLNYDKQLNSIAKNISDIAYQRGSAFATRIKTDSMDKAFTTSYGNFGAKGIDELNIKRIESFGSIFNVMKSMAKTPEPNVYKSMFTIPIAGINAVNKAMSIDGMIYDTVVKSVDIMRETLAKKSSTYTPTDIVNYIMTKRKAMEDELFSDISDSLMLQYSVYFSTTNEFSEYLNEMQREYKDDLNKMMTDVSEGNINYKNLSDTGKQILTELANRYNAERAYYDNLVSQRMYIEAQNKNIGKMGLGAIKQNWTSLMNSPYKKVRDAAGSRYTDIINEGLERDDVGSMVRKVRDIAINSFTDMKTAVINAVQEIVKLTQQTIKNGLDKMVMEGGSFKQSFKDIGDTIKKNYVGIYTNEIANQLTSFVYGSSMNAEKENPMAGVENSIAELNVNTSNDIKKFQVENDKNFLTVITSLDKIREVAERIENKEEQTLIHGSVQHQEKMGSMLDAFENPNITRTSSKVSKNHRYDEYIREASIKEGVPENLIRAVIQQESSFNPNSVSNKGAVGLMQLMPETAKILGVKNSFDPEDNIKGGTKYLGKQLRRFGRVDLALAAYNAGPDRESLRNGQIPPFKETQDYVKKVMGYYKKFGGYTEPSSNFESISRTGQIENNDIVNVNKEELSYVKGIFEAVKDGVQSTVSVYAPVINNITSGISGVETITDAFGGFDMPSMLGSSNPISGIASGISGNKYVQLASKALPGVGNIVNMFSGKKALTEYGGNSAEKQTPLKGIFGTLFGTVENVESKFGGASVGSFLGNMMSGKGIVDSLASASTIGADTFESLKGANSFTKVATGLTSTLFGKTAGAKVAAKLTGTKILGASLGTAIPVVGAVASVLGKKGWFGGAKDRTAEGRARGDEFNSLRSSLVANRNTLASNYYLADSEMLDALKNYQFGDVAMWTSKRGHKWKGTKRTIMNTDATSFVKSLQRYWNLVGEASDEHNASQRRLNKLQNTNYMQYLTEMGVHEQDKVDMIKSELDQYKSQASKYYGHDTGFTQTLFDGKSYTLTELNEKIMNLTDELGNAKNAVAENTDAIIKEKLDTENAKLDYETAKYGKNDPLISYRNEIQKLNNEWYSVNDGKGYVPETKEWYDWQTRMLQATENLEEATKNLKISITSDWIDTLKRIQHSDGTYNEKQVHDIANLYRTKTMGERLGLESGNLRAMMNPTELTETVAESELVGRELVGYYTKKTGSRFFGGRHTQQVPMFKDIYKDVEHTYSGTSPIAKGAYTQMVNMMSEYNEATGNRLNWQDYFTKEGTYATLYDTSRGTVNTEKLGADISEALDTERGKMFLEDIGADTSLKDATTAYQNVINESNRRYSTKKRFHSRHWHDVYSADQKRQMASDASDAYLKSITEAGYGAEIGSLTQKGDKYLYNAGGAMGNYQLYQFTQEEASKFIEDVYGKTLEEYMDYASTEFKVDDYALRADVTLDDLFTLVNEGIMQYSDLVSSNLEHKLAMTEYQNTTDDIKTNLEKIMNHTNDNIMDNIIKNIESIATVNNNSQDFLDAGYESYDKLQSEVITPLIQNVGNGFEQIAGVYEKLYNSGFASTAFGSGEMDNFESVFNSMNQYQTAYFQAIENNDPIEAVEAMDSMLKLIGEKGAIIADTKQKYNDAMKLLMTSNAREDILGSISGFDDYEIANTALKEFNATLGDNAMKNLIGLKGDFSSDNIAAMTGIAGIESGDDPTKMYYEWQKKNIMQRIENEEEGSEEWYQAELDLWNLMKQNAENVKKKAEETTKSIEAMLGKIEETSRMRVAEEAKSQKGDVIFFDLGATRNSGTMINNMLQAIKTNDPNAQKLVNEMRQKLIGGR